MTPQMTCLEATQMLRAKAYRSRGKTPGLQPGNEGSIPSAVQKNFARFGSPTRQRRVIESHDDAGSNPARSTEEKPRRGSPTAEAAVSRTVCVWVRIPPAAHLERWRWMMSRSSESSTEDYEQRRVG
jgi:hypothetical protein